MGSEDSIRQVNYEICRQVGRRVIIQVNSQMWDKI